MSDKFDELEKVWPIHKLTLLNDGWISLRICWPIIEDHMYEVKDYRRGMTGTASYNGYEFACAWKCPMRGNLMLVQEAEPTHWRRKTHE